jgi:hemolysin activation/secretion protein
MQAQLNSPARRGDALRGLAVLSEGSRYLQLAYDLPVGARGLQLGLSGSVLNYSLVGSDFAALGSHGQSTSAGASLVWPLLRTRTQNLYLTGGADARRYVNEANTGTQSRYATRSLSIGVDANRFDGLGAGGATQGSLTLQSGRVAQGALDPGEDSARAGRFTKLRGVLLRRQGLTPDWSVSASLRGQYTGRLLDSSERFYLGGPDGVRAYPVNEGSGSQGHLASLELRLQASHAVNVAAIYDRGYARDPGVGGTMLKGFGLAAAWVGPKGSSARITVARRLGHNPNATATGADQDGSRGRTRVWLQARLPF